jgi:hypothetical protein
MSQTGGQGGRTPPQFLQIRRHRRQRRRAAITSRPPRFLDFETCLIQRGFFSIDIETNNFTSLSKYMYDKSLFHLLSRK